MAGLEHSRWLVWYSNIFGLMPIRMEVDAKTGKFQKLYCSWGHPATWWFILLFIFRVAMEFWIICNSESVFNEVNTEQSLPTKFTFILQFVTAIITLLTPLLILGFHKNLAKAWEYLKRFDSNIEPTRKWTCTSKRRIVCGVFLALLVSTGFLVVDATTYEAFFSGGGTLFFCCMAVYTIVTFNQSYGLLLFVHLAYYAIAHRVRVLTSLLARRKFNAHCSVVVPIEENSWNSLSQCGQLRMLKYLYYCLCRTAVSLGASFSLVIWLITVVKIVTLITNLFFAILTYLQSSSLNQYSATHVTVTVLDATYLFILFVSVDMPAKEIKYLQLELMNLPNQSTGELQRVELTSFQSQISDDHFRLVAGGQFQVGMHLIPSLVGAVLTYLIILLQSTLASNKTP